MGWPRKGWIDTVKDCLYKRGLDIRKARRMVHDMSAGGGLRGEMHEALPGG